MTFRPLTASGWAERARVHEAGARHWHQAATDPVAAWCRNRELWSRSCVTSGLIEVECAAWCWLVAFVRWSAETAAPPCYLCESTGIELWSARSPCRECGRAL